MIILSSFLTDVIMLVDQVHKVQSARCIIKWKITICLWILFAAILTTTSAAEKNFKPPPIKPGKNVLAKSMGVKTFMKKTNFGKWLKFECPPYAELVKKKTAMTSQVMKRVDKMAFNTEIPEDIRKAQVDTLMILLKELNETDVLLLDSFKWMDDVMRGDYNDFPSLKKSSELRLNLLRDATMKEEQEFMLLKKAEVQLKALNHSQIKGIMDDVLNEIADAADQLDELLDDHVFENAMNNAKQEDIHAVIKLDNEETKPEGNTTKKDADEGGGEVIKLVDADDNQFVMSKGKDSTVPHEDHQFIADLVVLILVSTACGWVCACLHLPTMFGYIVGGVIVGPSGFSILKSVVQLETLGEFGVFFILFTVGMEFSPANIKKVFRVATLGTILMTGGMVVIGLLVGFLLDSPWNESCFVAACLSLSSTPLVIKFLHPTISHSDDLDSPAMTDYGTVLLGLLIMQDVVLGLLMALLPTLAGSNLDTQEGGHGMFYVYSLVALKMIGALAIILLASFVMARWILGPIFAHLHLQANKEIIVLSSAALAFITMLVTDHLAVSMELGCFIAGVMVSAQGHAVTEEIETLITPVKDFLACIFFASIGLHVFPSFMVYELTILTTFTMATVGAKYLISLLVMYLLIPKKTSHIKWIVAAGLSQVSEFSFVLSSRARQLGLVSREVYLLILSVTTCSLLFAPILWKATLHNLHVGKKRSTTRKQNRSSSESSALGLQEVRTTTGTAASSTAAESSSTGSSAPTSTLHGRKQVRSSSAGKEIYIDRD